MLSPMMMLSSRCLDSTSITELLLMMPTGVGHNPLVVKASHQKSKNRWEHPLQNDLVKFLNSFNWLHLRPFAHAIRFRRHNRCLCRDRVIVSGVSRPKS